MTLPDAQTRTAMSPQVWIAAWEAACPLEEMIKQGFARTGAA